MSILKNIWSFGVDDAMADEAVEDEPIALEVVCMLIAQTPQVEGVRLFAKRMRKLCSKLVRIERGGWESGGIC